MRTTSSLRACSASRVWRGSIKERRKPGYSSRHAHSLMVVFSCPTSPSLLFSVTGDWRCPSTHEVDAILAKCYLHDNMYLRIRVCLIFMCESRDSRRGAICKFSHTISGLAVNNQLLYNFQGMLMSIDFLVKDCRRTDRLCCCSCFMHRLSSMHNFLWV